MLSVQFSSVKSVHIVATMNFFILSKWNSVSIKLPIPFAPQPLAPTILLSRVMSLTALETSH